MRQWTNRHWFRQWLVAWSAPSHYLNQCWNIVDSILRIKLQWNPRQNSFIFIFESVFENVVCEMASIWSRPQWVNHIQLTDWNMITHPCPYIYGGLVNPSLELGHGWIITSKYMDVNPFSITESQRLKITKKSDHFNTHSRGFVTYRDLMAKLLHSQWTQATPNE